MQGQMTFEELEAGNILNSAVLNKYKVAAEIANSALVHCVQACIVGAYAADISSASNKWITEETAKIFQKVERGVAFPTCISINHIVQNCTPIEEYEIGNRVDVRLCEGDIVKIELGVHIDGYVATNAHTIIVSETPAKIAVTGPAADAICAAYYAAEAAARLIRPGKSSFEITQIIQRIAANFHCQPVQQTATYITQRYIIEGDHRIDNQPIIGGKFIETEKDMSFEPFEFEFDQVYSINIIMSSGKGMTRPSPNKSVQVLQRDVNVTYPLKLKSSRTALSDLTKHFSVFPFAARDLFKMNPQHKHGISECIDHRVVISLPVLEEMDKSAKVAQFKFGLLLTRSGAVRLTTVGENGLALPFVHSVYSVDEDIKKLVATDMKKKGESMDMNM